jgi:8-hydroxy-5-deazaflavin:NADPH oxidoreductase
MLEAATPIEGRIMKIGIVGAGRIGGNAGTLFARSGHEVLFSGSRTPDRLEQLAVATSARSGSPREAVEFGEVVFFSVPWPAVDELLAQTGSLEGKIVIDTTNQFVTGEPEGGLEPLPTTVAETNQERMPGARLVRTFNTLAADSLAEAAARGAAVFLTAEDDAAKETVAGLIRDVGFTPVDLGGWAEEPMIEVGGAVSGWEYSGEDGLRIGAALSRGGPAEAARLAGELRAGPAV